MHKLEESQYEIDVFEALLERSSPNVAWGLTLGGQGTQSNPLHIAKVRVFEHDKSSLNSKLLASPTAAVICQLLILISPVVSALSGRNGPPEKWCFAGGGLTRQVGWHMLKQG